jgi:hypothetical protein
METSNGSIERTLAHLNSSLESSLLQLRLHADPTLECALHCTETLPDAAISQLASKTLDLLSEVRLLLEPGHLVLADHFMGAFHVTRLEHTC